MKMITYHYSSDSSVPLLFEMIKIYQQLQRIADQNVHTNQTVHLYLLWSMSGIHNFRLLKTQNRDQHLIKDDLSKISDNIKLKSSHH